MKKTAFCLTFILMVGTAYTGFSQTYGNNNSEFFIPQNAMVQRVEKLPPINIPQRGLPSAVRSNPANVQNQTSQNAAETQPQQKIIRYQAIDGRFIPIYAPAEEVAQTETPPQSTGEASGGNVTFEPVEDDLNIPETATANSILSEPEAENTTEPALKTPVAKASVKVPNAVVQSGLPDYRNRYAQYLVDLQTFSQTKDFPPNEALNASLNKMDSNREVLIYKK